MNSLDLLQLVKAIIAASGTSAGQNVYGPGDWPAQEDQYPLIRLRLAHEGRVSAGRGGGQQFTTVATIRISYAVSEPAKRDDRAAEEAEAALWALKGEIDRVVINSFELERRIQQIPFMNSQPTYSSEAATHLAGMQTDLGLEFYEGIESFAPIETEPLGEITVTTANGAGLHLPNLQQ